MAVASYTPPWGGSGMAGLAWVMGVQGRILHEEELGARAERRERWRHRCRSARPGRRGGNGFEQSGTTLGIQMRRHLVEQQDRLPLARGGAQPRLGQHQAHEQRLLLPGRAVAGQASRGALAHQRSLRCAPIGGAPRLGILPPGIAASASAKRSSTSSAGSSASQSSICPAKASSGSENRPAARPVRRSGRARSGAALPRSRPRRPQPGAPGRRATTDRTGRPAAVSPAGAAHGRSARAASRATGRRSAPDGRETGAARRRCPGTAGPWPA